MRQHHLPIGILACVAAVSRADAAIVVNLPGTTETAGWHELGTAFAGNTWAIDGFPTSFPLAGNPWPGLIAPNVPGSSASAAFGKSSGGGYFASSTIYNAGTPGLHILADESPLADLSTLVIQFDLGSPLAAVPTFAFNGGTTGPAPVFAATRAGNHISGFSGTPEPTTVFAWQWDLRNLGPISDWSLTFATVPHGTIYEIHLDGGDTFAQVIPEPGAAALAALSLVALLRRRR